MPGVRYVFLDVAGTLLDKPGVLDAFVDVLAARGVTIERDELARRHKLCTEAVPFPVQTDPTFYRRFNAVVLRALGLAADDDLLDDLASACAGQPWIAFDDVAGVVRLGRPIGIISNWDLRLRERLAAHVGFEPFRIVGSAESGVEKPDVRLYQRAARGLDCAPDEILYVGDSIRLDVEPAASLGWRAVLLDRLDLYPLHIGRRVKTLADLDRHLT